MSGHVSGRSSSDCGHRCYIPILPRVELIDFGRFLLATLHFESLSRKLNRKEVRACLRTLPSTLDATYEQALLRLRSQADEDVEVAETILFWILGARRLLTVVELQHMYAMRDLSCEAALRDEDLPDAETLTQVCGGLVTVHAETQAVRLVHYTAQKYLQIVHQHRLVSSQIDLAGISLAYLTLSNFSDGVCTTDADMASRLEAYPFLDYASCYWGSGGAVVWCDNEDLWESLRKLTSDPTAVTVACQVQNLPPYRHVTNWSQEYPRRVPALVTVASFELPRMLRRLVLDLGHDLEACGSDGQTPLIRAADMGLSSNVSTLLELGAAVNVTEICGETALERAVARGAADVVRTLLNSGADYNMSAAPDWTVLMTAASVGNAEVVKLLLDAGLDPTTKTSRGDTALSIAVRNGQEAAANILADSGAVLPAGAVGRRAAVSASKRGLNQLVRRLTAHYEPVATRGIDRQYQAQLPKLDAIPQDQDSAQEDLGELPDEEKVHGNDLNDDLDGLGCERGFLRKYNLLEQLGVGDFAEVFACENKITMLQYAVKMFPVVNGKTKASIREEITALKKLRHPNLMTLVSAMMSDSFDKVFLVVELAPQHDLFNFIVMKDKLTEPEGRRIFSQIFSGLAYCVSCMTVPR